MAKLKKAVFNYLVDILQDYPEMGKRIKERELELRHPYRAEDANGYIKGNQAAYSVNDRMLITIDQDWELTCLERSRQIIATMLEDADEDTQMIIRELYLRKRPIYTLKGLIDAQKLFCSRSKAFELRDAFFMELARRLFLYI